MRLRAVLDPSNVERSLDAMQRRAKALGGAWRLIKGEMREDQRDHAKSASAPDGKWPPRAAATLEKAKSKGRARRTLGKLPTSTTYTATSSGAQARSRVPWSGVHQEGGTVGRGSVIPARPFLWISDNLIDRATLIITRRILAEFGGG